MSFFVAFFTKRHKVLRLVTAPLGDGYDMMDFELPVVNRNGHTILVNHRMKRTAVLTGELVSVKYPKRISVSPSIPYRCVLKLAPAIVGAIPPSLVVHFPTAPRALILLLINGSEELYAFVAVHLDGIAE